MLLPQIPLNIPPNKVLQYLGIKNVSNQTPQLLRQINDIIQEAKIFITPTAVINQIPFCFDKGKITLGDSLEIRDPVLKKVSAVSVVAVTVGEAIEQEATLLFRRGETTRGVIMDAVGTVAVEAVAEQVIGLAASQMRLKGLYPTPKLGPGYRGVPMEYLPDMLELADALQIKITCNDFYQMNPSKSLCFVVGWGSKPFKINSKCDLCQKTNCLYRS
ncbi:hypothetical protein JCM14036_17620 [Desulfotomaculum defluvii]